MSTTSSPIATGPSDEGAIESLLLEGLDAYFAGQYERAIHAWERVLFADRGHARARAYIERARQVIAERQREDDASLQAGIDAFDNGDIEHARAVLSAHVRERGADDRALALLQRLERLEAPAVAPSEPAPSKRAPSPRQVATTAARPSRKGYIVLAVVGVAILAAASWLTLHWESLDLYRPGASTALPASVLGDSPLPVPRWSESVLRQARDLYARGHLREALQEVRSVPEGDPLRPEADRLRAEIQRALLAASGASQVAPEPSPLELPGTARP